MSWVLYEVSTGETSHEESVSIGGEGKTFKDAMKMLTTVIFEQVILQNFSYKILVEADWDMLV